MQKKAGDHLGPYQIQSALGAGGMGEVYLALDPRLNRRVVLKIVNARLAGDGNGAERLRREARAIASLDHPNICTLYEIGQDEGTDYLVMQYLEGETVADLMRRGPVPLDRALQIAIDMASALSFAHRHGVLHRDIKPQNAMVLTDGRAKLLDFGIARTIDVGTQGDTEAVLTRAGSMLGTLEYMAPEQLAGRRTDARSDVFSLALVIYQLVTGHHPFGSATAALIVSGILTREYSHIPGDRLAMLNGVLEKALSRDPDARHASAAELLADLERLQRAMAEPAIVAGPRRAISVRTAVVMLAAALAAVIVAVYVVSGFSWTDNSRTNPDPNGVPSAAVNRTTVDYWFDVRSGRDGEGATIKRSLGTEPFASGSKFRITLNSAVQAFVYMLNDDGRDLSLAYPLAAAGSGDAVPAVTHETDWFGFSGNARAETLWIVWSADRVTALDSLIPSANERDLGIVRNPQTAASLRQWLTLTETRDVAEKRAPDPPRVMLSFTQSPLVRKIMLQHEERSRP